jgi:hypothetical protein
LIHQPIAQWNTTFTVNTAIADLANIEVVFTYETETDVLELSIAGIQVQQTN